MKRVVSVWTPDWPITVWRRTSREPNGAPRTPPPEDAPFALVEHGAHGLTLLAVNAAARAAGLSRGQSHADARAMLPKLISAPAEPERDLAALKRLALWAERYSPAVMADARELAQEGLLVDMTGGAYLFGGEASLLADIRARLARAGIPARVAIADTPAAAWGLARYSVHGETIAPPGRTREAIAGLPTPALRLSPEALALLRRFGLKTIGELYGLPRAGLARRFRDEAGLRLVERLDQALGIAGEPLVPERPAPVYRAWVRFAEPLIDAAGVGFHLPGLAEALAAELERDGRGARRLVLTAFRVDGRTTTIEAGLSAPAAAPAHLVRLLRETGLERLDLGFGIDAMMLSAARAEPLETRQAEMTGGTTAPPEALAGLIDRLQARLGEGAVRRPRLRESWIPERSEAWILAGPQVAPADAGTDGRARPILLFDPPEPVEAIAEAPDGAPAHFRWRRAAHRVVKAAGPERLSPEWWRDLPLLAEPEQNPARLRESGGPGVLSKSAAEDGKSLDPRFRGDERKHEAAKKLPRTRDYYRVEDDQGRRFWLFREGLYNREDLDRIPSWWMHGVFA
jgi:protein ImuB